MLRLATILLAAAALAGCTASERTIFEGRDYPVYRGGGYPRASARPSWSEGRPREAIGMCRNHAENLVRGRGAGRAVEVDEITRADESGNRVKVQGYVRVRERDGGRHRAWIDCEVDFRDRNEIVAFYQDGLFRRDSERRDERNRYGDRGRDQDRDRRRDGDRDRDEARRRDQPANAVQACRRMAGEQGYEIGEVRDRDRTENGMRVEMRLRRGERRFEAVCLYNASSNQARFLRLEPQSQRR